MSFLKVLNCTGRAEDIGLVVADERIVFAEVFLISVKYGCVFGYNVFAHYEGVGRTYRALAIEGITLVIAATAILCAGAVFSWLCFLCTAAHLFSHLVMQREKGGLYAQAE